MQKGKAFILVGHKHWGKGITIEALVGSTHTRTFYIKSERFHVRHASNEHLDPSNPNKYLEFIDKCDPTRKQYHNLIITLGANFQDRRAKTKKALKKLKKNYQLYLFVLKHHHAGAGEVDDVEIEKLKTYGEVRIYSAKHSSKTARADKFRRFIPSRL